MKEMIRVYELTPVYDSRKSFYGKAKVIEYANGHKMLQSYETIVSDCDASGNVTHRGKWSMTTSRHQREFERQFAK